MKPGELELEEFKIKELQKKVNQLCVLIKTGIELEGFFAKEKELKNFALRYFPEKEELYDLLYRSRFKRIWSQFRGQEVKFEEK